MYVLMHYQGVLITECFITHITALRSLSTMYAPMSYQIVLNECLFTHITGLRALTTMYAFMSFQSAL